MTTIFPLAWWIVCSIQLLGLGSAALVRMSTGTILEYWGQTFFFSNLLVCGMTTGYAVLLSSGWWMVSGGVFAAMVLVALVDFRPNRLKL
ncbi:MAG: hypothetical protein SFX18_11890 [Pirellulales bacterium]|nr:hypothetical protein [Pirellulales bacterium]